MQPRIEKISPYYRTVIIDFDKTKIRIISNKKCEMLKKVDYYFKYVFDLLFKKFFIIFFKIFMLSAFGQLIKLPPHSDWRKSKSQKALSYIYKQLKIMSTMAQIKAAVKKQTAEEIKKALEAAGVKVRTARTTMASSSLPAEGVFTGFETEPNPNNPANPIIRMIAEGKDGSKHKCALGRLVGFGLVKTSPEHRLTEDDIVLRRTQTGQLKYQLAGGALNPSLPTAQHLAIEAMLGKEFKAIKRETFNIAYLPGDENFESKQQALDSRTVADFYQLQLVEETEE